MPWQYAGQQVWLRPSRGTHLASATSTARRIARTPLTAVKGDHRARPGALRRAADRPAADPGRSLTDAFLRRFPGPRRLRRGRWSAQQRTNAGKHLRAVLALAEVYAPEALAAAFAAAREYNTYSHRFVRGLLEAGDATRQRGASRAARCLATLPDRSCPATWASTSASWRPSDDASAGTEAGAAARPPQAARRCTPSPQILDEEARTAAKTEMSYTAFLTRLVDAEVAAKADRSVQARSAMARLPASCARSRSSTSPSSRASRPRGSASWPSWASSSRAENCRPRRPARRRGRPIWRPRSPLRACQARKRVLFVHAPALLDQLAGRRGRPRLGKLVETLGRLDLLVVDELGYPPMDAHRANLFFQLVSHLYTRASIVADQQRPLRRVGARLRRRRGHRRGHPRPAAAPQPRLPHHRPQLPDEGQALADARPTTAAGG